ncbi:hypothetical protein K439DRAFT_1624263 [Ramaria rubella]|nr:hypothetical protein K439DRAFT_1624263 [Ramaria rubella]
MHASWEIQTPDLVAAYLQWQYGTPTSGDGAADETNGSHLFKVTAVGISVSGRVEYCQIVQWPNERANVALLHARMLGCSPLDPSVAIYLECLELYHQIRHWQSSFSLQAMAKVLCALHNVTYFQIFHTQLSMAFDLYLNIQQPIQEVIDNALERHMQD